MRARKDREYDPVCTSMKKQHKNVNQHETGLEKMLEKNIAPTQTCTCRQNAEMIQDRATMDHWSKKKVL